MKLTSYQGDTARVLRHWGYLGDDWTIGAPLHLGVQSETPELEDVECRAQLLIVDGRLPAVGVVVGS